MHNKEFAIFLYNFFDLGQKGQIGLFHKCNLLLIQELVPSVVSG